MKKIIILLFIWSNLPVKSFAQWAELGTGTNALNANSNIQSVATYNIVTVYAVGYFSNGQHYTQGQRYVAKWDGSTWIQLGDGITGSYLNCIFTDLAGNVYRAGDFTNNNGRYYIAKWDGTSWVELGTGANALNANAGIQSIAADNAGNIYAAGNFSNGATVNQGMKYVAKWNGTFWSDLGLSASVLHAQGGISKLITDVSGNVYAIADTTNIITEKSQKVYKWNGTNWAQLGIAPNDLNNNGRINSIAGDNSGNIYVAGTFTDGATAGDGNVYVAKWNGVNWAPLGTPGEINFRHTIYSLTVDITGKVYAAGNFDNGSNNYVAMWNGSAWSSLNTVNNSLNANGLILVITAATDGSIYAAGLFTDINGKGYVAKYSSVTLPIKLLSFSASLQNTNTAKLQWQIATAEEDSKYELQRSADGRNFSIINLQTGTSSLTQFNYTDNGLPNGSYYYRLKMIDKDGKVTYSNMAVIKVGSKEQLFSAYPNPVKKGESLQINLQNITAIKIEIINTVGQVVYSNNAKITGSTGLPVSFASGQYILRVISKDKTLTQKLAIQ
jgi:hypothetical protein